MQCSQKFRAKHIQAGNRTRCDYRDFLQVVAHVMTEPHPMWKILRFATIALGLLVGLAHFRAALAAAFVFQNAEPWPTKVMVVGGPMSTLPAAVMGIRWPLAGGLWLVIAAVVSSTLCLLDFSHGELEQFSAYLIRYGGPMLAIGVCYLVLANQERVERGTYRTVHCSSDRPPRPPTAAA